MTRRRTTFAALAATVVTVGALTLPSAQATPADGPVDAVTEAEWACLALGDVDLGLCLDDPIPDLGGVPTLPELLEDVLTLLG